ncbi:hypothetical protein HDV01_003423 [Terramyces sp. JEL0728]|nr:hypothetical protein HDV01_003423 [Terramyces sp. JEL0728]
MIPTLLHLRPTFRTTRNLLAIPNRLISNLNQPRVWRLESTMPKYFAYNQFKPVNISYRPYTALTQPSNKGKYIVTGLAIFGAISLIPDLFSTLVTLSVIGIVALTYIFTFSFVFTIGLLVVSLLALIAVAFSIPAIDLYTDTKKMIESKQLGHGWKVVPLEHRGLISKQDAPSATRRFDFDIRVDSDADFKNNVLFKMYIDLGKVVADSTSVQGKVSLQRECFGWWVYSIPFDLDYIQESEHHSASF